MFKSHLYGIEIMLIKKVLLLLSRLNRTFMELKSMKPN